MKAFTRLPAQISVLAVQQPLALAVSAAMAPFLAPIVLISTSWRRGPALIVMLDGEVACSARTQNATSAKMATI